MTELANALPFLATQLADHETHWSLGTFGALAEFTRAANEPAAVSQNESSLSAVTGRGGIRITPPAELRLFASESATRQSWSHRVALCLPEAACAMSRRAVLTELGPDTQALRDEDRAAILFDLGLDTLQVDCCVRVADPQVAAALRAQIGRSVFAAGNPAMGMILATNPHRVFINRVGRIEVYQPIPPSNGRSPEGPHTHVLPKLLQGRRTHAATEPAPDGFVPCAHLYPAHPAKDALGRALPFDARRHDSFQRLLRAFGDPSAIALKHRVIAAIAQGKGPSMVRLPDDRFARAGVRVALRQMQAQREGSPALAAWLAAHDRLQAGEVEEAAAVQGHE
jgi:hypothetical protein